MCGGSGSAKRAAQAAADQQNKQSALAEQQRQEDAAKEAARQAQIGQATNSINTQFGNTFNDSFFNNLAKQYTDTYSPQLGDQFTQARKNLAYNLSSKGLTNSSVAADQYGQLQDKYNTTQQEIQDKGLATANTLKQNVSSTQSNLLNQANAGSDLNSINNLVTSNLQTLQAPQTYDPLGNIFGQLALSAAAAGASGQGVNPFSNTNSGVNVGASTKNGIKTYS